LTVTLLEIFLKAPEFLCFIGKTLERLADDCIGLLGNRLRMRVEKVCRIKGIRLNGYKVAAVVNFFFSGFPL